MKLDALVQQLSAAGLQPQIFASPTGAAVVITPHGARVLGVFTHKNADNAFFVNAELATAETAKKYLAASHVMGGDRLWLAPERGLFFHGQTEKDGVSTQSSIDPGNYLIGKKAATSIRLINDVNATFFHIPGSIVRAKIERSIRLIPSPLADFPSLVPAGKNVHYAGYEIASRMELLEAPRDDMYFGLWFLIQMAVTQWGGMGHLYVPTWGKTVVTDYYEPTGPDYMRITDDHVRLKLDSIKRHKIGIRKTEVTGRVGFLSNADATGEAMLIVRNLPNNPSGHYADVPLHTPSGTQDSVQSYNHFSGPGGFGELEYHAPGICRAMSEPVVSDTNQVWVFTGPRADLVAVASKLLGLPAAVFSL